MTSQPYNSPWSAHSDAISKDTYRTIITHESTPLSFREVIDLWGENNAFRKFWTRTAKAIPFDAYCWENPPLIKSNLARPFECVFVNNPELAKTTVDSTPFEEHLSANPGASVASFNSLGGDALLIAPCPNPGVDLAVYNHLCVFLREAPEHQVDALWSAVTAAINTRISNQRLWLSTAGMGVFWLHVRLDSRPKYYRHRAYAREQ